MNFSSARLAYRNSSIQRNRIIKRSYEKDSIRIITVVDFISCASMKAFHKRKSELVERNRGHKIETFTEELIKDLPEPLKST